MHCLSLTSLPDELFFRAILGEFKAKYPCEAVKAFSQICLVCSAANEKVKLVWKQIIQQSDLIVYLFPSSKTIACESAKDFLKFNYQTLKKWSHLDPGKTKNIDLQKWVDADPHIHESMVRGYMEQCVLYNYQGNPELWVMWLPRRHLFCVDLKTQQESTLPLEQELHPVTYSCHPCMALSDSWIAVCCDLIEENSMEIAIINKTSGIRLHTISDLGQILKMAYDDNYLYVLCKQDEDRCKLLQYNSYDWQALPKEFCLPKSKICAFYIGVNYLLFSAQQNQLFAISKMDCFSNAHALIMQEYEAQHHKIQSDGDIFYILVKKTDSVVVGRLCVENSAINFIPIQTLPLNLSQIHDFNIQLDKIFIIDTTNCILCYDLINGQLMKRFSAKLQSAHGTNFGPTLVASEPERIQFLFSSIKFLDHSHASPGTSLLTLSFAKV